MAVPTTTKDRKLTLKQRKWLKLYIKTGSATEAARQAYDCTDESARTIGSENIAKLNVSDLMEDMGLSRPKLLAKLDEGLDSMKQISARVGGTANAATDDFIEVPDYMVRHKYLETAFKLNRSLGPDSQVNVLAQAGGDMSLELIGNEGSTA